MAESGIYEIVNLVNGKRYVGSAVNLDHRKRQHFSALRLDKHHNVALSRAWAKYGEQAFEFRVIERCRTELLIQREQAHIDERAEYNCSPTAGSTRGVKFSDEARARISAGRIGKRKGVKQSPDHVAKRMAAHIGAKRSPETRAKIAAKAKGRKFVRFTDEYRRKLSEAAKGRMPSEEHMAALQEGRRKRIYTEEQRATMAQRTSDRWSKGGKAAFGH